MMYGIMAVAFIGMIIGLQKEKGGAAWGRPMAILCIIIALGAAGMKMFGGKPGGKTADINTRYQEIKGEVLGAHLAQKYAGKKALILLPPEMPVMGEQPAEPPYKGVLSGLEKALGSTVQVVGKLEPKMPDDVRAKLQAASGAGGPEDMAMMPEGQMWFNVKTLNTELEAYKGKFDILICLTSLPGVEVMGMGNVKMDPYTKLTIWPDKNVTIALAEGGINKLGRAIRDGKIVAAVTYKQQISDDAWDKEPPSDLQEAFGKRFVLITPENLTQNMAYFSTK